MCCKDCCHEGCCVDCGKVTCWATNENCIGCDELLCEICYSPENKCDACTHIVITIVRRPYQEERRNKAMALFEGGKTVEYVERIHIREAKGHCNGLYFHTTSEPIASEDIQEWTPFEVEAFLNEPRIDMNLKRFKRKKKRRTAKLKRERIEEEGEEEVVEIEEDEEEEEEGIIVGIKRPRVPSTPKTVDQVPAIHFEPQPKRRRRNMTPNPGMVTYYSSQQTIESTFVIHSSFV